MTRRNSGKLGVQRLLRGGAHARVVDEDVDRAQALRGLREQPLCLLRVGQVRLQHLGPPALLAGLPGGVLRPCSSLL